MRSLYAFLLCVAMLAYVGCAGSRGVPAAESRTEASVEVLRDSLRAKFVLTVFDTTGKPQDLDAVLFSVPGKRYRMELTGPMGIGVASLLWTAEGWNMVFPTEKQYLSGVGYMVGVMGDDGIPLVPIHQVADLFDGILVPVGSETLAESDSAGVRVVSAKAPSGFAFRYGVRDGKVEWLSRAGSDGKTEMLKFSDFRTFENVETPENIVFEKEGKTFLKIRIRKVTRKKAFSPGTWRLNVPKTYKRVGA